jgi:2-polyprenyl-6-methoxyphenol hydroxylase-like FAD-dependent oxidoreductase
VADIIVIGGGVAGLSTGMLLAMEGHRVQVLERDPAPAPDTPDAAWERWERRGVNQFRMIHLFLPRFRQLLEAELPVVAANLEQAGGLRYNLIAAVPQSVSGGVRADDDRFTMLTARRPVVEAAMAAAAAATDGLEVRRGVAAAALLTAAPVSQDAPHVCGVRTADGHELHADLIVDAGGRRSPMPRLLTEAGAKPVTEELEDSGFIYYGRHFRSADGTTPAVMAPPLSAYGSVSILTLAADNGTWGVAIIASAKDAALRGLKDVDRWMTTLRSFPLVAHWADGEPLDEEVAVMAKIEDRIRSFVVDRAPVATGVLPVADAWACTNPSLGRGATLGLEHSVALRDLLRRVGPDAPEALVSEWDRVTREVVEPWYRATLHFDRHRLAEIEAAIADETFEPGDVVWELTKALLHGSVLDPDVFRGFLKIMSLLETADEVLAEPGFADKVMAVGGGWRDAPILGPSRPELVALAGA